MMDPFAARERVVELLRVVEGFLDRENESNWINGIRSLRSAAEREVATKQQAIELIQDISRRYRSMTGSAGSFTDYYIHREDPAELIRQNELLDRVRAELWTLLWDAV